MSKDKLSDYDGTTAGNNTDIGGISIAEGMLPSAVNNSMRELTRQLGAFANGTEAVAQINFGDNAKAVFGADTDAEIFHNGTHFIIRETNATGNMLVRGNSIYFESSDGSEQYATFQANGAINLKHDNATKLSTTSTGIDVTGTVTADGLTVDSGTTDTVADFRSTDTSALIRFTDSGGSTYAGTTYQNGNGAFIVYTGGDTSGAGSHKSVTIDGGGDISFYDSAGSSQSLFWDASTQRLGLGTTGPTRNLEIYDTDGQADFSLVTNTTGTSALFFADTADSNVGGFQYHHSTDSLDIRVNDDTRMTITSGGSVGIGTASPASPQAVNLHISGTSSAIRMSDTTNSLTGNLYASGGEFSVLTSSSHPLVFKTANSEAARIDSSGNLLVGKTSIGVATVGVEARGSGILAATRSGGEPLTLNRTTSDGTIIDLKQSGTTVGSIGVNGDRIYLTNAQEGIMIDQSANNLSPTSSTGTFNDAAMNLGESGNRWQDLYLSGGAYLGGTAAANKLDDYEEGTFTPTFTSTGASFSYGVQGGNYTKVGRLVMCSFRLSLNATPTGTTSNVVYLSGLPFSSATLSQTYHGGSIGHYFGFNLSATGVVAYQTVSGTSTTELKVVGDNLGETAIIASHLNSNAEIRGQVIYHTS